MGEFKIAKFSDPQALADATAREWVEAVVKATQPGGRYTVALAGGRIAGRFMAAVAQQANTRKASLGAVHFFWSDERCVPPTSPESNFGMARDAMLSPLGIPDDHIHRIRGEDAPQAAAQQAETDLGRFAAANAAGQPVLDLVFLGVGPEGHVASLFPGEPEALKSDPAVFRPVICPKPPPQRITMGYAAIAAARQVWVLASGAGKEQAVRESLEPGGTTPLARVRQLRAQTRLFTDLALG